LDAGWLITSIAGKGAMDAAEREGLRRSAGILREALESLNLK
jgi:hypothetical protein